MEGKQERKRKEDGENSIKEEELYLGICSIFVWTIGCIILLNAYKADIIFLFQLSGLFLS